MKLLIFADMHGSQPAKKKIIALAKKENPDMIISAGDITIFERNMNKIIKEMVEALKKPILMVHGNHEISPNLRASCLRFQQCKFMHKRILEFDNVLFIGWGGGGFAMKDAEFEKFIEKNHEKIRSAKTVVLITHGPPFNTTTDIVADSHVGNKSYNKVLEKYSNIVLHVCGHIHDTFGAEDKINNAHIINPGPFGKLIKI